MVDEGKSRPAVAICSVRACTRYHNAALGRRLLRQSLVERACRKFCQPVQAHAQNYNDDVGSRSKLIAVAIGMQFLTSMASGDRINHAENNMRWQHRLEALKKESLLPDSQPGRC